MTKIPFPDLLVLLPGITGSVLTKDRKEIWAPSGGAVLRNIFSLGKALKSLEVADDDWTQPDLGDGVVATKVMPDVHLLPGLWKIDGYGEIEKYLLGTFALDKGNYLPFPYDWRRDNRASAQRLKETATKALRKWRVTSGNKDAKLVLVGHSMGGLVARYYVECLEGWKDTRAVITFGTPFYGSLNALDFLLNGFKKKFGPLSLDLSDMMQSLRSVHQLVPVYRCVYNGGAAAATPALAGLPGWKPAWAIASQQMVSEVEAAAASNRTDATFKANPPMYRPIVGTDQPTRQSAVVDGDSVRIEWTRGASDEQGDGTVPLVSAALAGTEEQRTFAPEQHSRLQNYDSMLAHLKGVLAALYQVRIEDLRSSATSWFSYRADDLYLPGEEVAIDLATKSTIDESLLDGVTASLTITDQRTGIVARTLDVHVPRTLTRIDLGILAPGSYTLVVRGRAGAAPLSDVLIVAAPEEVG